MNPFDLPDLQFLAFYAVLFVAALVLAGWLRHRLRQPSDEPTEEALRIGPYEIAYLFGSKRHAIDSVIVRLVHDRVLALEAGNRWVIPGPEPFKPDASELERAVYSAVSREGTSAWRIRWAVSTEPAPIKRRLQELGLMLTNDRAARFFPFAITLVVLPIGVIKYFVGFSDDVSPRFLVVCWLMSVFVAVGSFVVPPVRSRRGDRLLVQLREKYAALASQAARGDGKLSGEEMALVVGLFGVGILSESPAPELPKVLTNAQPMRLEKHADLWVPILGLPVFGGLFMSVPLVGTTSEDSLLGPFWIVVIVGGFFVFVALLMSVPRLEELVRREAWVPPGTAEHPFLVAIALAVLEMATIAGVMVAFNTVVQFFGG